ncbi:MAG: Stage V sporulation protein K [uncultured Aureispira sp.]|uniref:Stage V sporulation protein K n=1 Tax=uncultured Aureispira sp. TaxID=1331704 RepID=A0A6S6S7E2_9BACT|nr:MAG: Stage V sporulation protein K [uncultured Aureispira sp.]
MKDDQNAIGGNYKFSDLKIFGSVENFYKNLKTYRRVFDTSECRYIYGELSFYNKLFDERDWKCQSRLVCTDVSTGMQICDMKKELEVKKDQNIVKVQEGWGTVNTGWWKKGKYKWDAYLDNQYLGTAYFYINDEGPVTETSNPYVAIKDIRLFESALEGTPIKDRKYLQAFNKSTTRYVNAQITIDILSKKRPLPLNFKFNFYNDIGQHKAYIEYFKEINDDKTTFTFDTGYGSNKGNYWFEDDYTLEVQFMNKLIAVVPFVVAQEEEVLEGKMSFNVGNKVERIAADNIEAVVKPTFEEASRELNALIGLETVKKQIDEFSTYLKFLKIREEKGFKEDNTFNLHTAFLGNPGTGKTTVAKMLGKIYYSLDLLTKGHVHEVGRVDLVGEYIGQTAPKVKKAIDKARGGILFIDEAYALSDRGDEGKDFGKEVIEVLLKEMSDGVGDIAIVFAGYPKEMQGFISSNPGMSSRISGHIHFSDYVPNELMEIAAYAAKKRDVNINEEANVLLHKKVVEAYRSRDQHFGNARFVNGIIEECKQNMALRLMKVADFDALKHEDLSTIVLADIEKAFGITNNKKVHIPVDNAALDEALKELHEMIGLEDVKRDVDEMAKLVRYYTEIGRDVKKAFSMHTVFTGNPGTGKTTVARILVKIYKALGILERGHLVECDRKELVAGYTGQTAIKTSLMIDQAIGGGLFIDEAYSLTQGGEGDFGREAVETLLKRMEDQRGDFIVIAAGYPDEMHKFLEINPGLMSRFDRTLNFPDYTTTDLMEIAQVMFDKESLYLDVESKDHLTKYIEGMLEHKHKYFGNARSIRKVVKEIARRQNLRLASLSSDERTSTMVRTVTLEDFKDFKLMDQTDKKPKKGIGFR